MKKKHMPFVCVCMMLCPALVLAADKGATVESISFETSVTAPVYVAPKSLAKNEAIFRAGLEVLPESMLAVGALAVGGGDLGLSPKEASSLGPLLTNAYAKIKEDPAFCQTPSALPYCFSTKKQVQGHYFLYRPEKLPEKPECIVFLHGFGGNFQFYMWVLKEEFPDAVILAPSWGVSWHGGSAKYIKDMLADAGRRAGVGLGKPWLMAISAGGQGGIKIYNQASADFSGFVCLAAAPEISAGKVLSRDLRILMLNGKTDTMVPIAHARKQAELAKRAIPSLTATEIKGDHFFLLSNRDATFAAIRQFMQERP